MGSEGVIHYTAIFYQKKWYKTNSTNSLRIQQQADKTTDDQQLKLQKRQT
jgi:hypothetical protein